MPRRGPKAPGGHIERAAAFMLFTELEPSILCPVSMSYAVTPALRAQPALFEDWLPKLASTQLRRSASCPSRRSRP